MDLNLKGKKVIISGGTKGIGRETVLSFAKEGATISLCARNQDDINNIVIEIDALGGQMAKAIDITGIQFRRLNTSRGAAVQATRAQADSAIYAEYMQNDYVNNLFYNFHI